MRVRPLILGLLVLTVLTGSVVVADSRLSSSPTPTVVHPRPPALSRVEPPFVRTVQVDGRPVPVLGLGTVGDALRLAGADLMAGRLVGVVTHRGLGSDHKPGHALLDGVAVPLETPIATGSVITRVSGADAVEPVETVDLAVPSVLPTLLYVGGAPGVARVVRGKVSHEVLSSRVLRTGASARLVVRGAVALTFDDGPDPTWTPQVLALLARAHVHATFCLVGRLAAAHPELVKAILAGGHSLCNHTWDHDEQLPSRSASAIRSNLARASTAIKAAGGRAPLLFRAPGGNWSPAVEAEARAQHMAPLKWTVDPRDWSRPGTSAILANVFGHLRPGGVILLHDGGGNRAQTLAALPVLLRQLPTEGFRFVVPPTSGPARGLLVTIS